MSIEKRVADVILQRTTDVVTIGGYTFEVAQPTTATLILMSEAIADLPIMDAEGNIVNEVLANAKECAVLGKIGAILILGAKRIRESREIELKRTKFGFFNVSTHTTELEWLTDLLLNECSPKELAEIIGKRLIDMQIADFFALTISLNEANLLKRTREVGTTFGE